MRDAVELEKLGKPTVTISHDKFERASHVHARSLGMPDLCFLVEPAPKSGNVSTEVKELARENIDMVVRSLTSGGLLSSCP